MAKARPKPKTRKRRAQVGAPVGLASQDIGANGGPSLDPTLVATTGNDMATGNGIFDIIGQPGFMAYGGFVVDEVLRELMGKRGRSIYREMADNDSTCAALIFAFNTLMGSADWTFQPVDDSPAAQDAADFAEDVFFDDMDVPFSDAIAEAATMLTYGFALQEIVWKRRDEDNRIGIAEFAGRRQSSIWQWVFDKQWKPVGAVQQPPSGTQITLPLSKCVLHTTVPGAGNPEGRSVLRGAYRSWAMKKKIENIEGIGIERDLAGLPMMRVPAPMLDPTADPLLKTALASYKQLVKRIRRDSQEGIVLPSSRDQSGHLLYELELLSTGGTRSFDTTKVLDRYAKGIAMSVLADFIFLGQASVGSFALSSDKTELFGIAVGGFLDRIGGAFQKQAVTPLWDYNNMPPELMPTLQHSDVEQTALTEIATLISAMTGAGAVMFPDRDLENSLRTRMGLPLAPEEGLADQGAPGGNGSDDGDPTNAADDT